jgi:hypothetical protein
VQCVLLRQSPVTEVLCVLLRQTPVTEVLYVLLRQSPVTEVPLWRWESNSVSATTRNSPPTFQNIHNSRELLLVSGLFPTFLGRSLSSDYGDNPNGPCPSELPLQESTFS